MITATWILLSLPWSNSSTNTNLSCFFKNQSKNPNPNTQSEVYHNPSWLGEGGRGKTQFSSPFPLCLCLTISTAAENVCGATEPKQQWHFTASLPPLWPNTNVLKQQVTFYKIHKPKYKREYITRSSPLLTHLQLLTQLQSLKPRAKLKTSWLLRESRFAGMERNTSLCLFCCPVTPYQYNLTCFWNKID